MSSARGVLGDLVDPATLDTQASGQDGAGPEYSAAGNVEGSIGEVAQVFGLRHTVKSTLEFFMTCSAREQQVSLPFGSPVVTMLQGKELPQDWATMKVIGARHHAAGPDVQRRYRQSFVLVGIFLLPGRCDRSALVPYFPGDCPLVFQTACRDLHCMHLIEYQAWVATSANLYTHAVTVHSAPLVLPPRQISIVCRSP